VVQLPVSPQPLSALTCKQCTWPGLNIDIRRDMYCIYVFRCQMLEVLANWLWWASEYALCCQCLLTVCNYYICITQGEQLHTQQPVILLIQPI